MKGYKGFDKNLKCRDFQYEIGKEFETSEAFLCKSGFHFCENPHDVFAYYGAGNNNRFCEIEAEHVSDEKDDDSKRVCNKIKITDEVNVFQICKIAVSSFFENFRFKEKIEKSDCANAGYKGAANAGNFGAANAGYKGAANAGDKGAANAGDCGAANAGYRGAANAGYRGAANAGDCGAANAGNYGAANAGDCGAANAGDCGAANAGDCGAANAGDYGAANAGDYGAANAGYKGAANAGNFGAANAGDKGAANAGYRGAANAGDCGAAIVLNNGKVKGGYGCVLVARNVKFVNGKLEVTDWACSIVDGVNIKADTWYKLKDGKLIECDEE